ncbi:MAG: hypothetical protein AAGG50_10075, partial [Bacteroidota bacterium]
PGVHAGADVRLAFPLGAKTYLVVGMEVERRRLTTREELQVPFGARYSGGDALGEVLTSLGGGAYVGLQLSLPGRAWYELAVGPHLRQYEGTSRIEGSVNGQPFVQEGTHTYKRAPLFRVQMGVGFPIGQRLAFHVGLLGDYGVVTRGAATFEVPELGLQFTGEPRDLFDRDFGGFERDQQRLQERSLTVRLGLSYRFPLRHAK